MGRWLRRCSQLLFFAIFAFLFLNTEYKDNDVLPYAVNVFLRADPLVAAAVTLASRALISLLWPALVITLMTVVLGRFFCGWLCPLGATLDFTSLILGRKRPDRKLPDGWRSVKFYLLALLAGSALFTLQLVFLFDPISILIRSLAVTVYPAMNLALNSLFGWLYDTRIGSVTAVSEPVYAFLKNHFLSFNQQYFHAALASAAVFFTILGLEYVQRRFWCRNLCPLGALLGILGRAGVVKRRVAEPDCVGCAKCGATCRMGAVGEEFLSTDTSECIECLDCEAVCPTEAITFARGGASKTAPFSPSRRGLIYSLGLGVLAAPVFGTESVVKTGSPGRIRPPGALPEPEFLARCTRCGECMRVCIANGLQPAITEAGVTGLFSPVMVPRIGYCEFNCTLCGQVCPTGAITRLALPEKQKVKLGLAEVDRSRCLPWKGDSECIVCEEHCPTPEKAIRLKEEPVNSVNSETPLTLKRPYVDEAKCIGCGICETKCPLTDRAAIIVTSRGETRAGKPSGG